MNPIDSIFRRRFNEDHDIAELIDPRLDQKRRIFNNRANFRARGFALPRPLRVDFRVHPSLKPSPRDRVGEDLFRNGRPVDRPAGVEHRRPPPIRELGRRFGGVENIPSNRI